MARQAVLLKILWADLQSTGMLTSTIPCVSMARGLQHEWLACEVLVVENHESN